MTFRNPDFVSQAPYHDDFDDAKNFLKLLFKPGYAVQARELTQLQTILQSQVAKFADHVFLDGSKIFGGEIQFTQMNYVRCTSKQWTRSGNIGTSTSSNGNDLLKLWQDQNINILGVYNSNFEKLATVRIHYYEAGNYSFNDPYSVIFYTVNGIEPGSTTGEFNVQPGLYLGETEEGPFLRIPSLDSNSIEYIEQKTEGTNTYYNISPFGEGYLVTVNDGIFYIDGYFVTTQKQTISLYKNSEYSETEETLNTGSTFEWAKANVRLFTNPSQRVGYTIVRDVVTSAEDITLNDPARGFYNYNAPGADRYKITLTLSSVLFESGVVELDNYVTEDFIQLLRTTRGVIDYTKNTTSYAQILDIFARRTYDESGSYTVKPFLAEARDHLRKDKYILTCILPSGTAGDRLFNELPIGGYIWPSQQVFDPFANPAPNLTAQTFPIGQVVDFVKEFKDNVRVFKIICELKSKKALTAATTAWKYQYKSGAFNTSTNGAIITTSNVVVELGGNGLYSLKDTPQGDPGKLVIAVQPGKAYVKGYEYETHAQRNIEYNALLENDILKLENQNIDFPLGNYAKVYFPETETPQDVFPTSPVNYEKLPLIELIGDVNEFRLFPSNISSNSRGIYAWTPFKYTKENVHGNMVDMQILKGETELSDTSYPHESVLFVYYDPNEE